MCVPIILREPRKANGYGVKLDTIRIRVDGIHVEFDGNAIKVDLGRANFAQTT